MEAMELDTSTPNVSEGNSNPEGYAVKVDGVEQRVSLDELQSG